MSYTTDLINSRFSKNTSGDSVGGGVKTNNTTSNSYTKTLINQRFSNIKQGSSSARTSLPPLISQPQVSQDNQPEQRNFFKKVSDFAGIGTGEIKNAWDSGIKKGQEIFQDIGYRDQQGTLKSDTINATKNIINNVKETIIKASETENKKMKDYFGDDVDLRKLTYDQIRDYQSTNFLKLAEEDLQKDLDKLEAKKNKTKIDNYRIKNYKNTLNEVKDTLKLSPEEKAKKDTFITGLALSRATGGVTAGLLGVTESVFDFVKWRSDVAGVERVSEFSEEAGDRLNEWAIEVRANNPTLGDKMLEGVGSTLPFFMINGGVTSVAGRLSSVSPRIAKVIGVSASAFTEAGIEAGSVYQENIDRGLSHEEADLRASRVFAGNVVFNYVTDKYGLFNDAEGVKKYLISGMGEGVQESWQNGLSNLATDRPIDENAGETFIIAFLSGSTITGATDVFTDSGLNQHDIQILQQFQEDIKNKEATTDEVQDKEEKTLVQEVSNQATNSLENKDIGQKEGSIETIKQAITEGKKIDPVEIRKTPEGDIVVVDGRHRLEASRQTNTPIEFVDVTSQFDKNYTGDLVQELKGQLEKINAKADIKESQTQGEEFDYSSTQLDLPIEVAKPIQEFGEKIPESELYTQEGDRSFGREEESHITVLYGLDTTNQADVRNIVEASGPIEVTLDEVSIFENDDYDVVKVGVTGEALTQLNKQLDEALDTPGKTFDDYQPHVTIAYVQKGQGAKYVGDQTFKGKKVTLNELTFSSKDGKKTTIEMLGKGQEGAGKKKVEKSKPKTKTAKKKQKVAEKVQVKTDNRLTEYYSGQDQEAVGQAWYEVMSELEVAEAGSRLYDADGNVVGGIKSTFPSWVPSELRISSLFDSVMKDISDPTNMKFPPNSQPRKQALYEEILSMIDSRAGTDSSDIIEEIKNGKKETKANESTKTSDRSSTGSKSSEEEIVLSQTIDKKKTKDTYNETLNLQDKDDLEYIERVFAPYQVEEFKKGNFGNRTKEEVEKILRANLINEKPKTLAEKLEGRIKEYSLDDKTIYHGTTADNTQAILDEGFIPSTELSEDSFRGGGYGASQGSISFSTDPKIATNFTGSSPRGVVFEATLSDKAKVVTIKDIDYAEDFNDFIPLLREQGIDAVYLVGEKEVAVINTDLIEIKSHKEFTVSDKNQRDNLYKKPTQQKATGPTVDSVKSGLQTKGAEKIDNFELRKPPKKNSDEFKLYKKVEGLIRKYAKTVGEGYTPRGALGVYYNKTKNIRVNSMNDLSVASHEIAHFLDFANNITENLTPKSKVTKELADLYVEHYPGAKPSHKNRLKMLEGYATLLQKYTEMPTAIKAKYPNLVKEMLKPGGKYYHEVIGDILTDLNEIVADYQELSSLDKISAKITSENTNIDKGSFLNFWQKLRTQIADRVYPVEVLAEKAGKLNTKEDPSLWVRAYSSISGVINNNISTDRGYWAFTDLQGGFQKKYDYNWKTLVESVSNRGVVDDFASYLVARREHFYYQELDVLAGELENAQRIYDEVKSIDSKKYRDSEKYRTKYRDVISELDGFGIDSETDPDVIKASMKKALQIAENKHKDLQDILDKDGFSREEVDQAYEEHKDRFKDEIEMFDTLSNEDIEMLHNKEVQLIDKKAYTRLKKTEGYASFKRQFYDEIVGDAESAGSVGVGGVKVSSLIKRTGSSRTIINPLYSALANHSEVMRKAMKQVVYNQIGNIGKSGILPTLFQDVQLKAIPDGNGRIIFPQEKDNDIIMARDNYKRKPILVDRTVKQTIDNLLTYKNIDVFTQLYTGLSRTFTAGTTGLYPAFALTNFVVDQITATANSYNKYKALYSPMKEMLNVMRNKNSVEAGYYEEYLVMGGERQTFTGWQKVQPKDLFKRIANEKKGMQKAIDALNKGVDILSIPSAKSEIFSRATEYINARKAGKSQIVALEEAGRVTAPFHHIGAWGGDFFSTYIRGLPFFNASIQVLDQSARVASTKSGRQRMAFVTMAVTSAYLSAILAMMDASDEQKEQYKDLEPEDLTNFVYFPNPNGRDLIRVKMSNLFSVPGATMNMIIANKMFSANYTAQDVMESATAFLPTQFQILEPKNILSWLPQVFKPTAYTILNVKDYPRVTNLVPSSLTNLPARYQYNEGTSTFAKKLGELANLSPIKIDYLLTGYLGRASGFLTGKPGVYNPGSTIFRTHYFTMGRNVRQFYELKDENDGEYTAYQNWKPGTEDYDRETVSEMYRVKIITNDMNDVLTEYRKIDPEVDIEKATELRTKFFFLKEKLDDGTKPKNFSKWANDADKRRKKNKNKE